MVQKVVILFLKKEEETLTLSFSICVFMILSNWKLYFLKGIFFCSIYIGMLKVTVS